MHNTRSYFKNNLEHLDELAIYLLRAFELFEEGIKYLLWENASY